MYIGAISHPCKFKSVLFLYFQIVFKVHITDIIYIEIKYKLHVTRQENFLTAECLFSRKCWSRLNENVLKMAQSCVNVFFFTFVLQNLQNIRPYVYLKN
jgi:hypothetical protein